MKTDELIGLLSTGVTPVDPGVPARRFGAALLLAALGSLLLMTSVFGPRPDLGSVVWSAIFWEKLAFPECLTVGAFLTASRQARPGVPVGSGWPIMAAPVAVVWLAGVAIVGTAAPADRLQLILGHSWRSCPLNILLLSVPVLFAVLWAVKGLAPTRLRLAGAAAGLLAGAIATIAYCFHCPEMSPTFWSTWYLLGITLPAVVGALFGPMVLHW